MKKILFIVVALLVAGVSLAQEDNMVVIEGQLLFKTPNCMEAGNPPGDGLKLTPLPHRKFVIKGRTTKAAHKVKMDAATNESGSFRLQLRPGSYKIYVKVNKKHKFILNVEQEMKGQKIVVKGVCPKKNAVGLSMGV